MKLIYENNGMELDVTDRMLWDKADQIEAVLDDCIGTTHSNTVEVIEGIGFEFDYNRGFLGDYTSDIYKMDYYVDGECVAQFDITLDFEIVKNGTRRSMGALIDFNVNWIKY